MDWDKIIKLATEKMGVDYHTAHQWKHRNTIPHRHRFNLVRASKGEITHEQMERLTPKVRK
jgi:hypothetical protein